MFCTNGYKCSRGCTNNRFCDEKAFAFVWMPKDEIFSLQKDKARIDFLERCVNPALNRENIDKLMATVDTLEGNTDA